MYNTLKSLRACIVIVLVCSVVGAQSTNSTQSPVVPPLVKFSGVLTDVNSKALTGTVGVTFSLYNEAQGGAALWVETQNVTPDKAGHYSVMLGSTTTEGIPASLFGRGEARWLGVQAQGQNEQPRTLLMSVPYALKALDAETVGGLPPSAFMKAAAPGVGSAANSNVPGAAISGSGTANHVTKWTGTGTLGNSNIWDGPNGNVGIATTSPSAKLDVNGAAVIRSNATVDGSLTAGPITATSSSSAGTGLSANAGSSSGSNGIIAQGATGVAAYTTVAGSIALYGDAGSSTGSNGVYAYGATGVAGFATVSGSNGVYGDGGSSSGSAGVSGSGGTYGVYGYSGSGYGIYGTVPSVGVDAVHGVSASENSGVAGINNNSTAGFGVYGQAESPGGVGGGFYNTSTGDALFAYEQNGGYAAFFDGNVDVDGNLSKAGGSFKIDHPLDPANKYLYHSFVESPDMKNIYDGVATLNANGEATVEMPDWFGVLNRDFRYQLTCIGGFAPVYIAKELANNQFKIGGGRAGMRISWQITGIRQDAWANAHRIPVEVEKAQADRGLYLHPELFGAPPEKSVGLAHHPMMLKLMKQQAAKPPAPKPPALKRQEAAK